MEFVTLNQEEFESFSWTHPSGTFHQMVGWGKLKETNGWKYYLVGLREKGRIVAATLLLQKKVLGPYSLFYAPRGFLLDYEDKVVLETFTKEIKKFASSKKAIFVKIDPYLIYKERNNQGDIVEGGIDHSKVVDTLKRLGYHHHGFTLSMEDLQPRWAVALSLKDKTEEELYENLETTTKQLIRKNVRTGVKSRIIGMDEIEKFKDLMQKTADRRNFIDRPLSYYQNMLRYLEGHINVVLTELHLDLYLKNLHHDLEQDQLLVKTKREELETGKVNAKKTNNRINESLANIARLEKKIKEAEALQKEKGNTIVLGGMMFLEHGKEMLSLLGGAYQEYLRFSSAYTMNWDMIVYAKKHGFEKYNFYGISGNLKDENDPLYGLYDFKKGYGGVVEEYIGEFDLVVSKFFYHCYNIAFACYGRLKKLKKRGE